MLFDQNLYVCLALLVAGLISFAATPMVISLAHKINAIDVPKDARRVHKKPIPLIGGLAIFYGFIVSVLCFATIDHETAFFFIFTDSSIHRYNKQQADNRLCYYCYGWRHR